MDAQQFLAEFGHIANAPGGVARLRELALRLAVQGRLSSQSNNDEPVTDFLARIAHLARTQSSRRSRNIGTLVVNNPQELPNGWALVLVSELANPQAGFAFKANQFNQNGIGLPIIRVRDVGVSSPATYYAGEYRDEFIVQMEIG